MNPMGPGKSMWPPIRKQVADTKGAYGEAESSWEDPISRVADRAPIARDACQLPEFLRKSHPHIRHHGGRLLAVGIFNAMMNRMRRQLTLYTPERQRPSPATASPLHRVPSMVSGQISSTMALNSQALAFGYAAAMWLL